MHKKGSCSSHENDESSRRVIESGLVTPHSWKVPFSFEFVHTASLVTPACRRVVYMVPNLHDLYKSRLDPHALSSVQLENAARFDTASYERRGTTSVQEICPFNAASHRLVA